MYLEVQRDKPLFFFFSVSDLTDDGYIGNAFVIIKIMQFNKYCLYFFKGLQHILMS